MPKIGINGLGRIGRLALRACHEKGLEVVAVADRNPPEVIQNLLQRDSIHGPWPSAPRLERYFQVGVNPYETKGAHIPLPNWGEVDVLLECSGGIPSGERARMESGPRAVIISAPASDVDATIILGVNEVNYDPARHRVVSMSSCTANCVAPVLKVLNDALEVVSADVVSINAYTNAQRIVDAPHHDPRRARAAALNIVPTESSAVPSLRGLFLQIDIHGLAYRVPVACGSVCHIEAHVRVKASVVGLRGLFRVAQGDIIAYSEDPLVSTDVIGDSHSAVVDGLLLETHSDTVRVVAWYDNEWAYACRLADMACYIGQRLNG